jgi:hypothetical protein
MKARGLFLILAAVLIIIYYWVFIGKTKYPRPTADYYINDYAGVLMQATRSTIAREGNRLYELSKDEEDGGTQIVFATFRVETLSEIAEYDKTEIYREWKIGDNDMGLLVLMFFMPSQDNDFLDLVETQIETGYRMEQYLTPLRLGAIVDETLYSDEGVDFLDMGVANLLYELLRETYVNIYNYDSFNYDMDVFYEYLMNYVPDSSGDPSAMSALSYIISPYSTIWNKIFALLPFAFFLLYGGGVGILKAGGGSSGGHGIFRRRR